MSDKNIETIAHGLEPIALIIRAEYDEPGIQFFTPANFSQQVAYMNTRPVTGSVRMFTICLSGRSSTPRKCS